MISTNSRSIFILIVIPASCSTITIIRKNIMTFRIIRTDTSTCARVTITTSQIHQLFILFQIKINYLFPCVLGLPRICRARWLAFKHFCLFLALQLLSFFEKGKSRQEVVNCIWCRFPAFGFRVLNLLFL